MQRKKICILSFTFVISILLYLSFTPWKLTDIRQHILIIFLTSVFPFAIATLLIINKKRVFRIALVFFIIGLLFILRGFHLNSQFSLMDYFLKNNSMTIIEEIGENQIRIIHRSPISYIKIESLIIYCILNLLGIKIGLLIDKGSLKDL